jgi:hypothetical protein
MNISTLRHNLARQHDDIENKRKLADSLFQTAEQHEQAGDTVRAKLDRDSAERYLADATRAEQETSIIELEIIRRETKASKIDDEMEELTKQHQKDIEKLQQEKSKLL